MGIDITKILSLKVQGKEIITKGSATKQCKEELEKKVTAGITILN